MRFCRHVEIMTYFSNKWAWGDNRRSLLQRVGTGRLELLFLVGTGRLELPILSEYASETYAYTNSATCPPKKRMYLSELLTGAVHLLDF